MARYDIKINTSSKDVVLSSDLYKRTVYDAVVVDDDGTMQSHLYDYMNITVSSYDARKMNDGWTVVIKTPYKASSKKIMLSVTIDYGDGNLKAIRNPKDNSVWFSVTDTDKEKISIPQMYRVNIKGHFDLVLNKDSFIAYSGNDTDFQLTRALNQNRDLLLINRMGNIYAYPLTGVGLIDYANSNLRNADLANKIQTEFMNDDMVVIDASINEDSGHISISVDEYGNV